MSTESFKLKRDEKAAVVAALVGGIIMFLSLNKCERTQAPDLAKVKVPAAPVEVAPVKAEPSYLQYEKKAEPIVKIDKSGEKKLEAEVKSLEAENDDLEKANKKLQGKVSQFKNQGSEKVNKLRADNVELKTQNKDLTQRLAGFQKKLDDAESESKGLSSMLKGLKSDNSNLKEKVKKLGANLSALAVKPKADVDDKSDELDAANRKIDKLEDEIEDLRKKLAAKPKAPVKQSKEVFAEKKEELASGAQSLVEILSDNKAEQSEELPNIYKNLEKVGKHRLLATVKFDKGETSPSSYFKNKAKEAVGKAGKDSSFLVVGYASKEGRSDVNRRISRARAVEVAKAVKPDLEVKQVIRAFYLGETSRFGEQNDNNRIVEIWEIK